MRLTKKETTKFVATLRRPPKPSAYLLEAGKEHDERIKRGPGRPKGSGKLGARLELRSSPGEKERIEAAAKAVDLTANEWLRRAAAYCVAVKAPLAHPTVS